MPTSSKSPALGPAGRTPQAHLRTQKTTQTENKATKHLKDFYFFLVRMSLVFLKGCYSLRAGPITENAVFLFLSVLQGENDI